ncbi:MAG: GatB/YqeY domain-containing protein [Desulfohalobiaceae bacterium]
MSLFSRLEQDFLRAYKSKDAIRVAVLRMVKTAIKNKQIELGREPDHDEILALLAKEAKKRQESIDLFATAGRSDLVAKERRELEILEAYLPKPMTREELAPVVEAAIAELGASGMKDMGRVMQAVMAGRKAQVDGKILSELVRSRLSE